MLNKLLLVACFLISSVAIASEKAKELPRQVLFKNVHVWDGTSDGVTKKINVLIENNLIKKLRAKESDVHSKALVIDGKGRTLMPGLIDAHVHLSITEPIAVLRDQQDWMYWGLFQELKLKRCCCEDLLQ